MQESSQVSVYAIVRDRGLGVGYRRDPPFTVVNSSTAIHGLTSHNSRFKPTAKTLGRGSRSGPSHPQNKTHRAVVDKPHLHMGTEAAGCKPRMRGARQVDQPIEPAPAFLG